MKKIYSFLLFLVIGFAGSAQGYIPFPDSGATWVNGHYQVITSSSWPQGNCELAYVKNYCANGEDTVINSNTYTKIEICQQGTYQGAIRDNGGQWLYVPVDSTNEILLYDFNLEVGDTIYAGAWIVPWDYEINQVDSVLIFGEYRKRIFVESASWVEGIGNVDNGLFGENVDNISNWCFELECMSVNDSILWPTEGIGTCQLDLGIPADNFDFKLFPNPSSDGIFNIEYNSTSNDLNYKIVTPNGQVLQEGKLESDQIDLGSESGIYFIQVSNGQGIVTRRIIVQ